MLFVLPQMPEPPFSNSQFPVLKFASVLVTNRTGQSHIPFSPAFSAASSSSDPSSSSPNNCLLDRSINTAKLTQSLIIDVLTGAGNSLPIQYNGLVDSVYFVSYKQERFSRRVLVNSQSIRSDPNVQTFHQKRM